MQPYPTVPDIDDAHAALLDGGHLWVQELVDGGPLRFCLESSGVVRFGDRDRAFDPTSIPPEYRHAVEHVRRRLDRDALRAALGDVERVTFVGVATYRRSVTYDFDRLPGFLGTDVWSDGADDWLPPDAVEKIYERVGLNPINAIAKEVRAVDFDPGRYDLPTSAWYDGPAYGVLVRDKRGNRATIRNPELSVDRDPEPITGSADAFLSRHLDEDRIGAIASALEADGTAGTVEAIRSRALVDLAREYHSRLDHPASDVDHAVLSSSLGEYVAASIAGRS